MADSINQLSGSLTGTTPMPGGTSRPAKKAPVKPPAKKMANPLDVMATPAPAKKAAAPAKKTPARATGQTASRSRPLPQGPDDQTLEGVLAGIKQHESGGNYTARSSSSTASGAYQYLDSTWNHYGGYAHAWQAPPAVQDARARADVSANYRKYNGDWRKVVAAHFAGGGWVDKHPDVTTWDQNPAPGSNNPTVAQYVASVFNNAGIATDSAGATTAAKPGVAAASVSTPTQTTAPGQVGDASMGQTLGPNATDQQVKDYVSKNYGYLVGFLHDPELGPLLLQAAREGWDKDVLAGKLTQTNYWKKTSDTARMWDAQTRTDPAAQHQLVGNKMAELAAEARKIGVVISPLKLHDLAVTSQRLGWNPDQIDAGLRAQGTLDSRPGTARDFDQLTKDDPASAKQAVQNQANTISQEAVKLGVTFQGPKAHDIAVNALRGGWDSNRIRAEILAQGILSPTGTGAIQTGVNSLKASAGDYLVKISDPTLLQWSKDIASGKFTQDDFTNYLKEQAKSLFPGLASAIDRGVTPSHYVDPYRQYAASILDVNPDSIDFVNDPKYSKALFNIDPKTGERTQMSLADWQTYLRQQPEYANTAGAIDQGAQFATMLTKTFGKVA